MRIRSFGMTATLPLAILAGAAAAQTAAPPSPPETDTAAPESTADDGTLGDIVVTATRREERLQQVPISITAIAGDQLARTGITSSVQLTQTVPALNFRFVNVATQPTIRGVGTRGTSGGEESNVAIYIDGVYQVDQASSLFDLLNVDRVEVLRGPQGTLFGRNATGGLINFITSDPTTETQVRAELRYGRFDERSAQVYLSTGITDTLAFDISGKIYRDNGYIRDLVNNRTVGDRSVDSIRARLMFKPTDDFSIKIAATYSDLSDSSSVYISPYLGNTAARSLANDPRTIVATRPYTTATTNPQLAAARPLQFSAEVRYDVGPVSLQNTASYQRQRNDFRGDNDGTPFNLGDNETLNYGSSYFQNEFRLLSNGDGPFSYILGLYYINGSAYNDIASSTRTAVVMIDSEARTESWAGFGEATWAFADGWKAIAGLRYTHETRTLDGRTTLGTTVLSAVSGAEADFGKATYRAILQRDIGKIGNVYASYSRGFKSGVFNSFSTSPASVATRPEVLDSYEIGLKTDPLPWLRFNLSAFHYDYQDIQLSSRDPGTGLTVLFNAASAKLNGGEAELTARAAPGLNLRAYATYLEAKYTDFPGAQIFTPIFQDQSSIGGSARTPIGNASSISDQSGSRMIRAPKYTLGGSFDYTIDTSNGAFGIAANIFHSAKYFWDVNNRTFQPAYTQVNGELSWTLPDDRFRVSIWGKNLTDELVQQQLNPSALLDGVSYEKPRTYGVAFGVRL